MQPGYSFLNLALLWVNTWATFKALNRRKVAGHGGRSSRFQQRSKREMKTCLSVWVVWVSWKLLERVIDATIGMVIPFLHEMKCLFILLLIITRPWGTEPLVMNVLRPTIRPYTGIIDASLHWLELGGDFVFLVLCLPYHMLMSWWNESSEDTQPIPEIRLPENVEEAYSSDSVATHSPAVITPIDKSTTPSATALTQAAIEAHRKEQELQAEEEAKMKEIQERSARERMAHMRLVTKPPLPLPPKNAGISRMVNAAAQSTASTDLPASAVNLPINRKTSRDLRSHPPMPMPVPAIAPQNLRANAPGDSPSDEPNRPSIYPTAALAMPMPVRAQRPATRPAVHTNVSANISRPANPAPQIPSVVIPLTTQTLPRLPRAPRPMRSSPPPGLGSRTLGSRSDTLLPSSSASTIPLSEFGVSGHRRESADDATVSGESQSQRSQESGSATTTNGAGGGGQTWEDFMASLERQNQAAIHHPRGTSGIQINDSIPSNSRTGTAGVLATRENQEIMKRIAGMKKEVDEKLQRINERAGRVVPGTAVPAAKPVGGQKIANRAQPTTGAVGGRVKALEKMQLEEPAHAGQKRPRRAVGHVAAKVPLDGSSSSGEGGEDKPSPKRKKKELVEDDMEVDNVTLASTTVKTTRPTRAAATKVKDKVIVQPAISRTGTIRSTRSTSSRAPEVAVIPGVTMRTRGRGGAG